MRRGAATPPYNASSNDPAHDTSEPSETPARPIISVRADSSKIFVSSARFVVFIQTVMNTVTPFAPTSTVVRSPDQVSGDLDGKVVLLSIENGQYYNMNEVGSRIWALLETPMPIATLVEQLLAEFEVDRATCEKEVAEFLGQLQKDNLLKVVAA